METRRGFNGGRRAQGAVLQSQTYHRALSEGINVVLRRAITSRDVLDEETSFCLSDVLVAWTQSPYHERDVNMVNAPKYVELPGLAVGHGP